MPRDFCGPNLMARWIGEPILGGRERQDRQPKQRQEQQRRLQLRIHPPFVLPSRDTSKHLLLMRVAETLVHPLLDQAAFADFGPSGSGKSTLLNILTGLVRPTKGKVLVNGLPLFDSDSGVNVPIHQRRIGLVFQDSRLFPHHTVRGNLGYGFSLLGHQDRIFSFSLIVDMLELGRLLDQRPYQLSRGEKQRVALGRALLSAPRLLLLD